MERNRRVRRKRAQLFGHVIDEPIHVLRIKPARNDVERAFALRLADETAIDFVIRSSDCIRQSAHSKCPSFVFFVSRYFSLCGLASARIGTCSIISKP